MTDNKEIEKKKQREEEENGIFKISHIWDVFVLNWPWVLLSVIIAMGLAYGALRLRTRVYTHTMSILVKDDSNKRLASRNTSMALENLGVMSNSSGFENEIEIIKSTSVNARAVRTLHLYTSYFVKARFREKEIYIKDACITADMPGGKIDSLEAPIDLKINKDGNKYTVDVEYTMPKKMEPTKESHTLASLPGEVKTKLGTVVLTPNPKADTEVDYLHITVMPLTAAARSYRKRLSIQPQSKQTTVAVITLNDVSTPRALDYLNELFLAYNEDANEDKNEVAIKTEDFIRERIELTRLELDSAEMNLEQYKRAHEIVDVAAVANRAMTGSTEYEKQQVDLQTQINLLEALISYVNDPSNKYQVIPVNLGLTDEGLNGNIKEYNEYVMQRKRLLKSSSEDNPMVERATSYIEEMGPTIKLSLEAIRNDLRTRKKSADTEFNKHNSRITNAPSYERELNDLMRKKEIVEQLHQMLRQKQEENLISKESTARKARIINDPEYTGMVSLGGQSVILIAILLGIAFPIGILLLLKYMRYNIEGRNDIEDLTSLPIISDIPLSRNAQKKNESIVVHENTNDMMEESFRGLRTNLRFILDSEEKVIISTSCIPGEGKTFVSANLAMSLALMGKRVCLVGLDIRKPRLVRLFNLPNQKNGITAFLTSEGDDYELLNKQIVNSGINKNLDILPAGVIPPNPSELISREQLDNAISMLKEHYDYIVLDTPPVGLVSDTLAIARAADMTIFVCRADYSPKANFRLINDLVRDEKLPKVNLVLNGVDFQRKKYGYYYGYGRYGRYGKRGYGKYGSYNKYGSYGTYGVYGTYGRYGSNDKKSSIEN